MPCMQFITSKTKSAALSDGGNTIISLTTSHRPIISNIVSYHQPLITLKAFQLEDDMMSFTAINFVDCNEVREGFAIGLHCRGTKMPIIQGADDAGNNPALIADIRGVWQPQAEVYSLMVFVSDAHIPVQHIVAAVLSLVEQTRKYM